MAIMGFAYGGKFYCWPSHNAISRVTGFSRQTTVKHVAILAEQGFIEVTRRPGHSDLYTLVLKKFSPDFQKSVQRAMGTLHPMLKRRTTNREWLTLIRNDRELRRMGR